MIYEPGYQYVKLQGASVKQLKAETWINHVGRTPFEPQQDREKGVLGQDTQTRIFDTCSGIV